MKGTQLGGRTIGYHDRGSGPTVVLLHPGFVTEGMVPLLGRPALSGLRLIAPHRRGYGSSDRAEPPLTMSDLATDTIDLLDGLEVERASLVGHYLGAGVAMEVARTAPDRVKALVLIEPTLGFYLSDEATAVFMGIAGKAISRFEGGDHEGAVETWLDGAFGPGWQAPLDTALPGAVGQATRDAPAAFLVEVPALQAWPFGPNEVRALAAPMLSVAHRDPWSGFIEVHQALVAAGAEDGMVDLPSHLMQILDPDLIAAAVADFLIRHG